jgi:hypothetical protein
MLGVSDCVSLSKSTSDWGSDYSNGQLRGRGRAGARTSASMVELRSVVSVRSVADESGRSGRRLMAAIMVVVVGDRLHRWRTSTVEEKARSS